MHFEGIMCLSGCFYLPQLFVLKASPTPSCLVGFISNINNYFPFAKFGLKPQDTLRLEINTESATPLHFLDQIRHGFSEVPQFFFSLPSSLI